MKVKFPKTKNILVGGFIIFLSLAVGYTIGINGFQANLSKFPKVKITRETPVKDLDFALFWKVWDTVSASYFDKSKLVSSKMVYGAIQGMVSSIGDPYTLFLPPSDNKITNEDLQGNFNGVGIEIGFKGTTLAVQAPLPGSPAERGGVKPGDLIANIKDDVKKIDIAGTNLSLAQAVDTIRGPAGSKVTLTLVREGVDKPIVVDLIREPINVPSITVTYEGDDKNIAHISIFKFGGQTFNEWQKAVQDISSKSGIKGIILDLRNNPGGFLQDAVDIAGEFLAKGSVVVIQESGSGAKEELKTTREGAFVNSNIVVLVNGGSASASEILAGALHDDRKIKLVGDKTFGKGTIQEPQNLEGGAGLHITIAKWLTPNATWVNGTGLDPDVKIKDNPDTKEDEQLIQAVQLFQ